MFIFVMRSLGRPYLSQNSSSKRESSKDFEHSSPMFNLMGRPTLPTLRCHMTGPIDVWHDIPTSASSLRPRSIASG